MPRIPEAQRQVFQSGIVRPQGGVNLGAIGAAAAPFDAAAGAFKQLGAVLERKQQQQQVADGAEFNSKLNVEFQDRYNQLTKRDDIIKNPAIMRQEIGKIREDMLQSDSFLEQPVEVQELARKNLIKLNEKFSLQGLHFENEQTFRNTALAIDQTQDNFDLESLTTDSDLDDMLKRYTATVVANVKSGALTEQQAEQQVNAGASSIIENRVQRFINEDNLDAASMLLSDQGTQEILGADKLQSASALVERKRQVKLQQAAKVEKLRFTDPWKFVQTVDSAPVPTIDFVNANNVASQIDNRQMYVESMNDKYNLELPVLSDQETDAFVQIYKRLPPNAGAKTLQQFTDSLPDEQQGLISDAIFKKDMPLGIAVSVADTAPDVAQSLLNGADVLAKKLIKMPPENDLRSFINDNIADVAVDPQFREAVLVSVKTMYADKVFQANDNTGIVDRDIVMDSLKGLLGEKVEVNGKSTLSYKNDAGQFLDQTEFQDLYRDLTPGVIDAIQGDMPRYANGEPVEQSELVEQGQLTPTGDGQYAIVFGEQFLVDKLGQPFILNMKLIESTLRKSGITRIKDEPSLVDTFVDVIKGVFE